MKKIFCRLIWLFCQFTLFIMLTNIDFYRKILYYNLF